MSNVYTAFTVEPVLLLDAVEWEIIEALGVEVEPSEEDPHSYRLYGEAAVFHSLNDEGDELSEQAQTALAFLKRKHPALNLECDDISVVAVLVQRCLQRTGVAFAAIEAGQWTDRMLPAGFGGVAYAITPKDIRVLSTHAWIRMQAATHGGLDSYPPGHTAAEFEL